MELPENYTEITVFDFIQWAIEHASNPDARDVLVAIKSGYVSSFNYLRTDRENGTRYPIDDRKKLAGIMWKKRDPSKIIDNITISAPFLLPCKRCGMCCYGPFRREYIGSTPPDDRIYFLEIDNTPCKVRVPKDMLTQDLGISFRCAYLTFDGENGLYGCKIYGDGIRSTACGLYSCDHMILNKKDALESEFGKVPIFPECDACKTKTCATCSRFPVQIEWFIAFIHQNKMTTRDLEVARFLKEKINEYELVIKNNVNNAIKMHADARWFDPYKKQLDGIGEIPSGCKQPEVVPCPPRVSLPF